MFEFGAPVLVLDCLLLVVCLIVCCLLWIMLVCSGCFAFVFCCLLLVGVTSIWFD